MATKKKVEVDTSTEEKIKEAARKVFSQKGYFGTRTRDIADEAGINLALVNYYFRSKEKLFDLVMQEKVYQLFGTIVPILINESLSLGVKIEIIADTYTDMLIENPDLPIMVFNELKHNPHDFGVKVQLMPALLESSFFRQIHARNKDINPVQFLLSIIGLIVFPFITKPIFTSIGGIGKEEFYQLMNDRKRYIPIWVNAILDAKI